MWHWTKDELGVAVQSCLWMQVELMAWEFSRLERLNGIKWSWVQFPHRPTFCSYFQESVSDEYHIYIYINVSRIIEQLWIYYLKFHDFTWRSWKKHETLSSKFIAVLFILLRSYILSAVNELQLFIIWYIYIYIYSTWCFEHCGDISCSLLVNSSHTDELWEGRNTCMWIYALNLFIEHSGEHWWEQNIFCSFTTPQAFW